MFRLNMSSRRVSSAVDTRWRDFLLPDDDDDVGVVFEIPLSPRGPQRFSLPPTDSWAAAAVRRVLLGAVRIRSVETCKRWDRPDEQYAQGENLAQCG